MDCENDTLETEYKRILVLNTIYNLAKQGKLSVNNSEITGYTDVQGMELYDILNCLLDRGWIKETSSIKGVFGVNRGYAAVLVTDTGLVHVDNTIEKTNI